MPWWGETNEQRGGHWIRSTLQADAFALVDPPVDEVGEEEVEDEEDGWDDSVELEVVRNDGGLRR